MINIFNNQESSLETLEPINFSLGKLEIKVPALQEKNIRGKICDVNELIHFETDTPIVLKGKKISKTGQTLDGEIEFEFFKGTQNSSLLKTERERGIHYLNLYDSLNQCWSFKLDNEKILNCTVKLDLQYAG